MRKITVDKKLYRDAVSLSPQEWMQQYGVHEGYRDLIDHFRVAQDGRRAFSEAQSIEPKLMQGWTRLFLLATQIASEHKGSGGRPPAHEFKIGIRRADFEGKEKKDIEDRCTTYLRRDGRIDIQVTEKRINKMLKRINVNSGHLPSVHLDPFQYAMSAGFEEGLHAEFLRLPDFENRIEMEKIFSFPSYEDIVGPESRYKYSRNPYESVIHEDLVGLHEAHGLKYDRKIWESFMKEHGFPWKGETYWRAVNAVSAAAIVTAAGLAIYHYHNKQAERDTQTPARGVS